MTYRHFSQHTAGVDGTEFHFSQHIAGVDGTGFHFSWGGWNWVPLFPAHCWGGWNWVPLFPAYSWGTLLEWMELGSTFPSILLGWMELGSVDTCQLYVLYSSYTTGAQYPLPAVVGGDGGPRETGQYSNESLKDVPHDGDHPTGTPMMSFMEIMM